MCGVWGYFLLSLSVFVRMCLWGFVWWEIRIKCAVICCVLGVCAWKHVCIHCETLIRTLPVSRTQTHSLNLFSKWGKINTAKPRRLQRHTGERRRFGANAISPPRFQFFFISKQQSQIQKVCKINIIRCSCECQFALIVSACTLTISTYSRL